MLYHSIFIYPFIYNVYSTLAPRTLSSKRLDQPYEYYHDNKII